MKIQRLSSDAFECPKLTAHQVPAKILDRAANGVGWVSLIGAVTSVALTLLQHLPQPEFAIAWAHPAIRAASAAVFLVSLAFIAVQRSGRLTKQQLLDLGMVFQVAIAFCAALFEGAAYQNPDAMVMGISSIAVWMMLCARLMPNAPLKAAATAGMCVVMWPAGYWVDLQIFGYAPMPVTRLVMWVAPLCIIAVWMYILNNRTLTFYMQQLCAKDMGSYTLRELIGSGGMGEVWRAKHRTLARDTAIKVIRPEVLQSSTARQEVLLRRRFEREAQATASLRSPHTVALYDFGESKCGAFYYVMELIEGIDLQTLVDRFGPMEPGRVIHILQHVAQSLDEAHQLGLVHRDIKPRNILLGKLGREYDFAKVLDFGLVKALHPDDPDRTATTMDGVTTGTPAYFSPEAAMGSPGIDGRSDLYSLGCTAYFLLTGCTVFEAATPTAYAIAHVQTPPPHISERCESAVPADLEMIVMELLEKHPADRIQSAHDLGRRLRGVTPACAWSPERAEQWWETNLPELSAMAARGAGADSVMATAAQVCAA